MKGNGRKESIFVLAGVTIAVMSYHEQSNMGRKDVFYLHFNIIGHLEQSHGGNSNKVGTWGL